MKDGLTAAALKELLAYSPDTGRFWWLVGKGGSLIGAEAGYLSKSYVVIDIEGEAYSAHRLAVLFMLGRWPVDEVDHRNGRTADNRWANLREATDMEQAQNRKMRTDNTSGHQGVSPTGRGRWSAQITFNKKRKHIGTFDTIDEAAIAYAAAKLVMHPFQPVSRVR